MIAIIDYDAGNLRSVEKALHFLGQETIISRNREEILKADKVILPGVGAFGEAMAKLKSYNLDKVVSEVVDSNKPFLGICLGLQLLFDESDEAPGVKGLGVLNGKIVKIPNCVGLKIPHMGWNSLSIKEGSRLFKDIDENAYVYFVHSFYLRADKEEEVVATTEYSTLIHASVERKNVFACQFHPEKSGKTGLKILENFAKL